MSKISLVVHDDNYESTDPDLYFSKAGHSKITRILKEEDDTVIIAITKNNMRLLLN